MRTRSLGGQSGFPRVRRRSVRVGSAPDACRGALLVCEDASLVSEGAADVCEVTCLVERCAPDARRTVPLVERSSSWTERSSSEVERCAFLVERAAWDAANLASHDERTAFLAARAQNVSVASERPLGRGMSPVLLSHTLPMVVRSLAFAWSCLALSLLAVAGGCGSGESGPSDSGAADASANDATIPREGGADSGDGRDSGASLDSGGDGSPADGAASEAGDASTVAVSGCAGGAGTVTMTRGEITVAYDLGSGVATFSYATVPKIVGFYAGVQLTSYVTSKQYASRACASSGDGVVITSTGNGLPAMQQAFTLDADDHFLTQVTVTA